MPCALCHPLRAFSLILLVASSSLHAEEAGEPSADATAEQAASAAVRPAQGERSRGVAEALAERLPSQEQRQLHTDEEEFLALWLPANAPEALGVVILLGGDGESPDWPESLGPLRRKLPDAGWHSLALAQPDPLETLPLAREAEPVATAANDEGQEPTAPAAAATMADEEDMGTRAAPDEEPAARHARRIQQRIAAALQLARQQQAPRIVLLGHGSGAYWSARYLSEEKPADVQNLLLVAPEQPADTRPGLDELLPELTLATGDFYYRDSPAARTAASERARLSKRQAHPAYIQVGMNALPGNPALEHEQLFRRLRGWLSLQLQAR